MNTPNAYNAFLKFFSLVRSIVFNAFLDFFFISHSIILFPIFLIFFKRFYDPLSVYCQS